MNKNQNYQELLCQKRYQIMQRIADLNESKMRKSGPVAQDFEEQALENQNDEIIDLLGQQERREVLQINQALDRLNEGTYGICSECGEDIEEKRLQAVPETSLCLDCARHYEVEHET